MSLKDSVTGDDFRTYHTAMLKMLKHFDDRGLTVNEIRICSAVSLAEKDRKDGATIADLAKLTGMTKTEIETRLPALIETRHVAEIVPTFGPTTYRIGASAGSLRKALRKALTETVDA